MTKHRIDVPDSSMLQELACTVGKTLLKTCRILTTAESCTGGWVAKCLTDVPGSSGWFHGAVVTYSDAMKRNHLGVDEQTLRMHGAVSEAAVREMAVGALTFARADLSVAVTGIAGPDGGSEEKPIGLVWFAWAGAGGVDASRQVFNGDRESIRRQSVGYALEGILRFCERSA